MHRSFRKPLIIATPKNLLRDKKATSSLSEMADDTRFKRMYGEKDTNIVANATKVRRLIACSGKIFYELEEERERRGITDVAIVRLEQIAPFPWDKMAKEIALYSNAEVMWVQVCLFIFYHSIWC